MAENHEKNDSSEVGRLPGIPHDDEPVTLGVLAGFIGYHLRMAQEASYQAFFQSFAEEEEGGISLRPGHFTILSLIGDNPGIIQTLLSQLSGRDKSTLTPILNMFARSGIIRRQRIATDRRCYALRLTAKGIALRDRMKMLALAHDARLDAIVGLQNKAELIRLLEKIKAALR